VQEAAVLLAAMSLAPGAAPLPPTAPSPEPVREKQEPAAAFSALRLDIAGVLDVRSLPRISGGPVLGASLTYGPWLSAVSFRYLVPRDANHRSPDGIRAPVDLFAGALTLGYRAALPGVRLGPLGEVELGYLRGRSPESDQAVTAGALWAALWGGLTISSRWSESAANAGFPGFSRVELSLACLLGFPLSRARFGFADEPPFYTTAPVGFRVFLTASVALWTTEPGRFGHSSSR
jgi:hypothetical protein